MKLANHLKNKTYESVSLFNVWYMNYKAKVFHNENKNKLQLI